MKLIVQIPCRNEARTLEQTVRDLPRHIEGFDRIEVLVVDDGSSDGTAEVARQLGVRHLVELPQPGGLAAAFGEGLAAALRLGADVIVNTDGDNQYRGADIAALVAPILAGEADIVVGARPIERIPHFSRFKKLLQRLGSWAVRQVSQTRVPDATSGFRAYSREAALQLNVFSSYTYTLETLIQAGLSNLRVASVPIEVNEPLRASRLVRSNWSYVKRSVSTMLRIFMLYRPLRFFLALGSVFGAAGGALGLRFTWYWLLGQGEGKIQSLILAAVLLLMGFQLGILGLVADLIATNRRILEELQRELRRSGLETTRR